LTRVQRPVRDHARSRTSWPTSRLKATLLGCDAPPLHSEERPRRGSTSVAVAHAHSRLGATHPDLDLCRKRQDLKSKQKPLLLPGGYYWRRTPNSSLWGQGPCTHTSAKTSSSPSRARGGTTVHSTRGQILTKNMGSTPSPNLFFNNMLRHMEYSGRPLSLSRSAYHQGTHPNLCPLGLQSPRISP